MEMNWTMLSKEIRFDNASKGFDPTEGGLDRYLLLTISELCEAQEELRDGHDPRAVYFEAKKNPPYNLTDKPCGFPVELADAVIRILDIFGKFDETPHILQGALAPLHEGDIESVLLKVAKLVSTCQGGYFLGLVRAEVWHHLNMALSLLLTLAQSLMIPIEEIIEQKLAYNKSRPPKHGRKF